METTNQTPEAVQAAIEKQRTRLSRAIVGILHKDPFFAAGVLACPLQPAPGLGTMATDGIRILWDPDTVAGWSEAKLQYVLAHEGGHVLLRHPLRAQPVLSPIPEQWKARAHAVLNIAMDYAVNAQLDIAGYVGAEDALRDPRGRSHSVERIFRELWAEDAAARQEQEQAQNGQGSGNGQGQQSQPGQQGGSQQQGGTDSSSSSPGMDNLPGPGTGHDPSNASPDPSGTGGVLSPSPEAMEDKYGQGSEEANRAQMTRDLAQTAINAQRVSRKAGGDVADARRSQIDADTQGQLGWAEILRRFLRSTLERSGYTFRRPSRRSRSVGLYLPSRKRQEGARFLAVHVDTSGSLDRDAFTRFADEIRSIADDLRPERIRYTCGDTRIRETVEFRDGEPVVSLPTSGGGGTLLMLPIEALREDGEDDPDALVIFTDGYGSDVAPWQSPDPSREPGYPVLWVLWGYRAEDGAAMPFGETVIMD